MVSQTAAKGRCLVQARTPRSSAGGDFNKMMSSKFAATECVFNVPHNPLLLMLHGVQTSVPSGHVGESSV